MSPDEALDPAEAFDALRGEVAEVRRTLEALGMSIERNRPADYTPTLGVLDRTLRGLQERLSQIETHLALKLTPQSFNDQVQQGAARGQRAVEEAMRKAVGRAEATARELGRYLDQARTANRQNWRLVQVGVGGLAGGAVLWVCLSGPIARALPKRWEAPERMAAATLAEDRESAGQRMIESASPQAWAETMQAIRFYRANRDAVERCQAAAAARGKAQKCVLRMDPKA